MAGAAEAGELAEVAVRSAAGPAQPRGGEAAGRRLATLRHDAGALNPIQVPSGRGGDQPTWACRSVVMVWASRRVSSLLVLTPPGFIQIPAESELLRN